MMYQVVFRPAALRALESLPAKLQKRIVERVEALAQNPRPHGAKRLVGMEGLYRIRVGDYRVLYRVEDEVLTILVVAVGHRREVYR